MESGTSGRAVHRNLVTGASGFVGCCLVDALLARGESVVGLSRGGRWPDHAGALQGRAELLARPLAADADLVGLLRDIRPTRIYHLAGFSHSGESVRQPEAAWRDNLRATECLLDAVRDSGLRPRLLHVSSGLVYARPADGAVPLDEASPLGPETPYGESKVAAEQAAVRFHRDLGLDVVLTRPFNHTGPFQSPRFAVPSFARQVAAIAAGATPAVIETGNLDVERDWSDVRDVVDAYLRLMADGEAGEVYNIGSGHSPPLRWLLDRLIELAGARVEVRPRADLLRAGEPASIRVDARKLRRRTGWAPRRTLDETLRDMLGQWRPGFATDGKG